MHAKYDTIGRTYNLTRCADPLLTQRLFYHLNPVPGGVYLDIGCGSGNYTHELQQKGFQFIGIDPSAEMLQKARLKSNTIDWRLGSAENIELPDSVIDGVTATLTIHHWEHLSKGIREVGRVLKPGGRFVIFTSTPEQMDHYWLCHYFPKAMEAAIAQMPTLQKITEAMNKAEITQISTEKYFVQPDLQDLFLQSGKHTPELYFKPEVRSGISTFAALANAEEVEKGLAMMRNDIDSGKITEIISSYESEKGDYLYIIGEKQAGV